MHAIKSLFQSTCSESHSCTGRRKHINSQFDSCFSMFHVGNDTKDSSKFKRNAHKTLKTDDKTILQDHGTHIFIMGAIVLAAKVANRPDVTF